MVRIVAAGDNDVDCYLADGQMYPGGNCFNVSVFARRAGAETAFIGAVGTDAAGELMRSALGAEGVDTSRLRSVEGATAHCIIGHKDNDRYFVSYDLGVSRFKPSAEDLAFIGEHDAVHVYQHAGLDDWLPAFAGRAKLSYDFGVRDDAAHRAAVAPHCFLATVSGAELGEDAVTALITELHAAGTRWVLVTRGSEGALLSDGQTIHSVSATRVEAIDTLGAGDCFIARVLVGLLREEATDILLKAAADEAAKTCGYLGSIGHGALSTVPLPERAIL